MILKHPVWQHIELVHAQCELSVQLRPLYRHHNSAWSSINFLLIHYHLCLLFNVVTGLKNFGLLVEQRLFVSLDLLSQTLTI